VEAVLFVRDFLAGQQIFRGDRAPQAPLISVILPTYRRCQGGLLRRAIDSVLTQSFTDFELIVMDDGSTDGSAELIEQLRQRDPRIIHVRHEKNCGLPGLRVNEGLELARGTYLAFQFDDDLWRSTALATLVRAIQQHDSPCIVVGKTEVRSPNGDCTIPVVELNLMSLYEQNRFANNSVLMPKSLVERYGMYDCHIAMRRLCDWDLWLRHVKHVPFVVVDKVIAEVEEYTPGAIGVTVPWDLSLFRYLHDIPRNQLLTPATWRSYQVDALRIGDVEIAKDYRRRVYEEQLVPYYARFRAAFPQIDGFRASLPQPVKTVVHTKNSYDITIDVAFNHYDQLASQRGSYKSHFQIVSQIDPRWPREADALLLVRVVEDGGKELLEQALTLGIPIGYYLDDDLFTFYQFGPQFNYIAPGTPYYKTLTESVEAADVVWVTNRFIAESVAPYNPRILYHGSCVPPEWLPQTIAPRDATQPLRIGYVGSAYRKDEFAYIWDALRRLSLKHRDKLHFEFWGLDVSTLPTLASPTKQVPFTFNYSEYIARLRAARFDVLLCPLLDHPRPRLGKYLIKYFETAVAGALGIFSDVPPYESLPDRLACRKVANTVEAWQQVLEEVIAMPPADFDRLRWRCVQHVREEHTTPAQIERHEAAWRATELHGRTRARRHADGRPRVLYVFHSAYLGGAELQLWHRARSVRGYGIEPIIVLPQVCTGTTEAEQLAQQLGMEEIQLEFASYSCFDHPKSPTEFSSAEERTAVHVLLNHCQPALVHTATFIPTFGQVCQELGIPHVASLYQVDESDTPPDQSLPLPHCTVNHSDSIRYARWWANALGSEWFCGRVVPEEYFTFGLRRFLVHADDRKSSALGNPVRIVMAGTLQERKRQAEAIEAIGRLQQEGIACQLDLYGYTHFFPAYHQRCLDLIARWRLQNQVMFHGFTNQLTAIFTEADVLLSPSTSESFPGSIGEAMAAGVLVVATPVGGIPELIIDGETGILCAGAEVEALVDGIRRAVTLSTERYYRVVEAARRVARSECHPHRAVNDLLTMYLRALEITSRAVPTEERATRPVQASALVAPLEQSNIVETINNHALGYEPLIGTLRYHLTPQRPHWKGIRISMLTPLPEAQGSLAFRVSMPNGILAREGEVFFVAKNEATWVKLEFPEITHANGQLFVLDLWLKASHQRKVGLLEAKHRRSRIRRTARLVGLSAAKDTLYAQLLYAR
jgi:O-antigen biosynthesis protein